jgi:hypothetical protein
MQRRRALGDRMTYVGVKGCWRPSAFGICRRRDRCVRYAPPLDRACSVEVASATAMSGFARKIGAPRRGEAQRDTGGLPCLYLRVSSA